MVTKPLDLMNQSRGSRVLVELRGHRCYAGTLSSFDPHLNIVLEDAEETIDGEIRRRLPTVLVRGDNIIYVSP
jgi:small nuclear ribonucleoprotein